MHGDNKDKTDIMMKRGKGEWRKEGSIIANRLSVRDQDQACAPVLWAVDSTDFLLWFIFPLLEIRIHFSNWLLEIAIVSNVCSSECSNFTARLNMWSRSRGLSYYGNDAFFQGVDTQKRTLRRLEALVRKIIYFEWNFLFNGLGAGEDSEISCDTARLINLESVLWTWNL